MSDTSEDRPPEVVIVRRGRRGDGESLKGGVWKIAYADFMTAMMAFFLVMWLINATSEATKQGVANYFNPIKLSDAKIPRKGVRDPEKVELREQGWREVDPKKGNESGEGDEDDPSGSTPKPKAEHVEDALFRDPYAVLAAIAEGAEGRAAGQLSGPADLSGGFGEMERPGSETWRDPFDPVAWKPDEEPGAEGEAKAAEDELVLGGAGKVEDQAPDPLLAAPGNDEGSGDGDAAGQAEGAAGAGKLEKGGNAEMLQAKLTLALERIAAGRRPAVEVRRTDGGLLISLTDEIDFGMFAIGSAEPQPETIAVMAEIAELLRPMAGPIIIQGHTDARPFRTDSYDNWRLSTARAHMAYYMLARGGLDETRVERIEGYADRQLKIPEDPLAAKNRRIEILLRETGA